jgi:hypothetical protein
MAINIQSLFSDIIETPAQRQERMLGEGILRGRELTGGLTGLARTQAPLVSALSMQMPQRQEALRRGVGGMLGLDVRTESEKVQEALKGVDPNDPQSLLQAAQAVGNLGLGTQSAQMRAMAADATRQKQADLMARERFDLEQKEREKTIELREAQTKREGLNFEQLQREANEYINNAPFRQESQELQLEAARLNNQELVEKLNNPDSDALFERDTVTFGNGLSIMTNSKGEKIVTNLQGDVLIGDERVQALQEAKDQAIEDEAAKASARRSGSKYADIAVAALDNSEILIQQVAGLNNAIQRLNEGAKVGSLDRLLAAFDMPTAALQTQQRELGLGVISSVTFGALSQGELDLALSINAPETNDEAELKNWYKRKAAATLKLAQAAKEQAIYFSRPGASIDGWYALQDSMRAEREFIEESNQPSDEGDPDRSRALRDLGLSQEETDSPRRRRRGPR